MNSKSLSQSFAKSLKFRKSDRDRLTFPCLLKGDDKIFFVTITKGDDLVFNLAEEALKKFKNEAFAKDLTILKVSMPSRY
jgi:hypothetical protein